ncbi:SCO family protein [Myxococcota bacterium]|nr:SCO family protein [Myxococcota bacterium]
MKFRSSTRIWFGVVVAVLLLSGSPGRLQAASVTLPNPVPLRSESVEMLRAASAEGGHQWKLVSFGFTLCKDVCPMTFGTLSRLVKIAAEKGIPLDAVFVTVDPDRDTDHVLTRYTTPYGKKISYLRLEGEALESFKDEFGVEAVFYTKNKGNAFHYQVDHSSMAFLIDPAGRIRVVFDALEDADSMATMLRENHSFFQ